MPDGKHAGRGWRCECGKAWLVVEATDGVTPRFRWVRSYVHDGGVGTL